MCFRNIAFCSLRHPLANLKEMSKTPSLPGSTGPRVLAARRTIESVRLGMRAFKVSSKAGFGMDSVPEFLNVQLAPTRETQVEASL